MYFWAILVGMLPCFLRSVYYFYEFLGRYLLSLWLLLSQKKKQPTVICGMLPFPWEHFESLLGPFWECFSMPSEILNIFPWYFAQNLFIMFWWSLNKIYICVDIWLRHLSVFWSFLEYVSGSIIWATVWKVKI